MCRIVSGKSFMYNTKGRGPRTVPCGIPDVTSCQFDSFPFTATFCLLLEMKASIQFTISLLIFILFNLLISLLCGTVSKAFLKSMYITFVWYKAILFWTENTIFFHITGNVISYYFFHAFADYAC